MKNHRNINKPIFLTKEVKNYDNGNIDIANKSDISNPFVFPKTVQFAVLYLLFVGNIRIHSGQTYCGSYFGWVCNLGHVSTKTKTTSREKRARRRRRKNNTER